MQDPWLRKKLDRKRRLREHWQYLETYAPELWKAEPGLVIDIGPGAGVTLEITRYLGHTHQGVDAKPDSVGGMGADYLRACRLIHQRQKLNVAYVGLHRWLGLPGFEHSAVLINMRGSIEQCYSDCMVGPPHDEHQRCDQLDWPVWPPYDSNGIFVPMMRAFHKLLRNDGVLVIHANGTKSTNSWYEDHICSAALHAGFTPALVERPLLHKWVKV